MLQHLEARFARDGCLVAGILSGTSGDGIDVVLARIRTRTDADGQRAFERPELLAFEIVPFPGNVAARVRSVLDGAPTGLSESALLSRDLGRAFGRAAQDVARRYGLVLDLAGSHGQTVYHHDGQEKSGAATLQLGDGDFVAEECSCAVVSDFRQRDIAAGGEGAPISALADGTIFAHVARPCAILNLGGMGNLTILGSRSDELLAFDTGPANSLLDGLARALFDEPFDRDGKHASHGTSDERLVRALLDHPFFAKAPPRSTGRDTFGATWVASVIERARSFEGAHGTHGTHGSHGARGAHGKRSDEDLMATAVEFVASTVADSLARFVRPPIGRQSGRLIVAGGGAHNRALILALERRARVRVVSSDEVGVPADAREGLVFAVLAAACALEIPLSHPGATGAKRGRVLGKVSSCSAS